MIGCACSGSGKEPYPSLDSVDCRTPVVPTNDQDPATLTFNAYGLSPHDRTTTTTAWNRYFPWRAPGTSRPIDSCGIASGFVPEAAVQYPHTFTTTAEEEGSPSRRIPQGYHGSALPPGPRTYWEVGAVVEVSFSLVVNHGGGYQYRVCRQKQPEENATATAKDGAEINEACFEQNPLEFVDEYHIVTTTTTAHESTDNSNSQKEEETKITIPATDVTGENVYPVGSTWRRIPIPACNCDSGGPCLPHTTRNTTTATTTEARDFNVAYTPTAEPYGTCPTGLQFYPEHITQGLWPEGYGYYVATLRRTRQQNSKEDTGMKTTASLCSNHFDSIVCSADITSECHWSMDKQLCYSGGNSKQQQQQSSDIKLVAAAGAAGSTSTSNSCYDYTNEDSCIGGMENGNQRCLWYESPSKTVCYNPTATATAKNSNADGTSTKEDADDHQYENKNKNKNDGQVSDWYITDRVYAPSETGAYILQWRWDNEQTPQIWTTCADIEVVADAAAAAAVAAATGTNDGQQQHQQPQNDEGSGHDNVDSSSRSDSTTNSLEHKIFPFLVAMMMTVGGVALL